MSAAIETVPGPLVELRDIGVTAGSATILAGIGLDVFAGEVLAVVGPNGAGKSTLLGVIAGDVRPTTGRVRLGGADLSAYRTGDLARRRAVLLQENRLSFPFAVQEVVRMGRSPWRGRPEEDDDDLVVGQAMGTADVLHLAGRKYPSLSGGEKSRTSFARVLAQDPRLLLLDEPTAALDIRHQERALDVARTRARAGDAVVVVLHDLTLAAAYADRMALLSAGHLAAVGPPSAVLTAERVSAVYEHPVEVLTRPGHDGSGGLLVLPIRTGEVHA